MKKNNLLVRTTAAFIALAAIFLVGCSKGSGPAEIENPTNPDPTGNPDPVNSGIVSGNPGLNEFIMTSDYEKFITVNPDNGSATEIFEFERFDYIHNLAHFENGIAYFTTSANAINALNLDTGQLVWTGPLVEYDFQDNFEKSITVCANGICYAAGHNGALMAFDQGNGTEIWKYSMNPDGNFDGLSMPETRPVLRDDRIYIISKGSYGRGEPATVHIVNKNTGASIAKLQLPFADATGLTFAGDTLLISTNNLYAINPETFDTLWVFEADETGPVSVSGNSVLVHAVPKSVGIYSKLYHLDLTTGNVVWSLDTGLDSVYAPLIVGNVVFGVYEKSPLVAVPSSGRPFAVDIADGQQYWFRDDVSMDHAPVFANGRLYFLGHDINGLRDTDQNSGLICMDANDGKVLWVSPGLADFKSLPPVVVAQNGVFGPAYYGGG